MAKQSITLEPTFAPLSLSDLCSQAQWVIDGFVTRVGPSTLDKDLITGRAIVYTDAIVQVAKQYKGFISDNQILVRSLGGETPELSMSVQGAAVFAPKEHVLLFLSKETGQHFELPEGDAFVVHGWNRGKYSIQGEFAVSAAERKPTGLQTIIQTVSEYQ